ncbi:MAG: lamin tail domain-containing protein [Candidatus Marinimicrobia bacterium]|nr:lamin tail domain-containing protein [Candidatus Neomarinimicrobiota bacterium]
MKRSNILIAALTLILGLATTTYANVYATNLEVSATVITTGTTNSTVEISFLLNEDSDSGVDVKIYSGATLVRTISLATATKGSNSVTWDGTDAGGATLPDGDYTFEVVAADDGNTAWTKISDDLLTVMYSPKGVSINRDVESPHFGTVYISNGYAGTSANTGGVYNSDGIYLFSGAQDSLTFSDGGISWGHSSNSPNKTSIGDDGRVYVTDYGADELYVFDADISPASAFRVLDADNKVADQYISANWVHGTGADRVIYTADAHYATGQGILEYAIGLEDTMVAGNYGAVAIERPNDGYYQLDVETDQAGNIYFCQKRADPNQAYPLLKYPPYTGTTLTIDDTLWTVPMTYAGANGIALDEASNRIAWGSYYSGTVYIHNATTGALIETFETGQSRTQDLAFDAAGNLYTVDNGSEYWHIWSSPDGANSFTSPGQATITIETPPEITTVFISELADPNNNAGLRFLELHNAADLALDLTGWELTKYTNASATVSQTLALAGSIPALGNFVIATGAADADFEAAYGMAPDMFDGEDNHVAGSNGDDNMALVDPAGNIVDIFGIPGEDGTGTNHEFEDGRAVRLATVTVGNPVWDPAEWAIDSDAPSGFGPQDAPDDFDPYVWPTIIPLELVSAVSISDTEIEVYYSGDLTAVDVADYSMTGTAVSFALATLDAADASLVHLVATAAIGGDAIADTLTDAVNVSSYEFFAGITPISFTNALNPGGQIEQDITGTFAGLVTANDGYNNIWVNDGNEAYMGILVFDYDFDGLVAVGDEIMFTGDLDIYNNLSELKHPVLLGTQSTGNPTIPGMITGADIDSALAADTNPAEQWEGQLVKIDGATVLAYDGTAYTYELTDDGGTTKFLVGDNVDYQFGSVTMTVGTTYDIMGVVDYDGDFYRLNPRGIADIVESTNDLNLVFEDDSDAGNWGVYDGATGYTTVTFDAAAGVDGSGAMVFGDGGYGYYIKRPITATVGTDYVLSVDLKTLGWDDPDSYPITLSIEGLEAEENSVSINSLTEFTNIILMGTSINPTGYIKLQGSNTSAAGAGGTINVTVDNLMFDDDYEPPPSLDLDLAFEDDTDAANWGVYDGATGYTTVAFDATAGVGGTGAMVFGDGGYGYYIKRPVAATIGTDYSLTIDIKTLGWDNPDSYPITLAVEGLDAVENAISINSLTDFTTITLTGTATTAAGYIKLQGSNTSAAGAGGTISVTVDNLMFDDNTGATDIDHPVLLTSAALSSSLVELVFNEDIDPVTGANVANYTFDHGIGAPTAAVVLEDIVTLTLGTGMMFDSTYTVIVNNVADLSGNVLLADTSSFMYTYEFVSDLFFSEYIEGSSNNKALEIFNPTDAAIDLAGYTIGGTSNEATEWEYFYTFPDTLVMSVGAMSTYVIADASADSVLQDVADWVSAYPGPTSYNGNDARGLFKIVGVDTILIDALGDVNNATGADYAVAGVDDALGEHTLLRKANLTMGNPDWMMSAGTDAASSEWVVLPQNTFRFLGAHPHTDLVGPELAGIVAVSETQLQLRFSEPVVSADALALANYSVSGGIGNPTAVTMLNDFTYLLTVAVINTGDSYTLTVNGINDMNGNVIVADAMIDFMLDVPGSLPIDRIINDFVGGIGNWADPTYSGSTYGVLTSSTFASTDTMAFAGTHSGEMVLQDDPGSSGGWFVRLWNINRVDRIDADSKMFFYLYGGTASMQARIVIQDDGGYEAGPWRDITDAANDWQVISFDLENDPATGWINGNGAINSASGTVGVDCIQIRSTEDVSATLFVDMVTERYNVDPVEVTFDVNMNVQTLMETFALGTDFVDVAGSFNGWGGTPMVMEDPDADSVYSYTVTGLYPGENLEYKFRINGDWATSEFPDGGPNRVYVVPDTNSVVYNWYDDVETYVGVDLAALPTEFALHHNYPNPFNPITNIKYDIPENTYVRLSIYNTLGQHVIDLVNEDQAPGFYHLQWNGLNKNGTPVSSGMFIYRLTTPEFSKAEKMTYLK